MTKAMNGPVESGTKGTPRQLRKGWVKFALRLLLGLILLGLVLYFVEIREVGSVLLRTNP
jgi:hypothetical protein